MIITIAAVVAVAILAVLALVASRPSAFQVQRNLRIKATPRAILALTEDFHRWPQSSYL